MWPLQQSPKDVSWTFGKQFCALSKVVKATDVKKNTFPSKTFQVGRKLNASPILYENVNWATWPSYKLQDTSQPICKILKLSSYKLQATSRFFRPIGFPVWHFQPGLPSDMRHVISIRTYKHQRAIDSIKAY